MSGAWARSRVDGSRPGQWRVAAVLLCSACFAAAATASTALPEGLERLVALACDRAVVVLGEEGGHGAGATVALKSVLVARLVDDCGFDAIAFESQVYDFVDLAESLAAGRATRAQVADAIGGLWSTSRQMQPLVHVLFERARDGRVRLVGLDPQTGGATQRYTQRELPARLVQWLPQPRRAHCHDELARWTQWRYDAASPWGEAAIKALQGCASAIAAAFSAGAAADDADERLLVDNLVLATVLLDAADAAARRSRAMAANLRRQVAMAPAGTRWIVWTATVHGIRRGPESPAADARPGAWIDDRWGERALVVGFSALGGTAGRVGQASALLPAPSGSLEQQALAEAGDVDVRVLDRDQLRALGVAPSRLLGYARFELRDWGRLLDAVVVLREETPLLPWDARGAP